MGITTGCTTNGRPVKNCQHLCHRCFCHFVMQKNSKNDPEQPSKSKVNNENQKTSIKHAGAVAANSELSVNVGIDILEQGGSAADSAIATLLMDGICNPQSMGLGGGFLCTHYEQKSGTVQCLNAREYAPIRAKGDLFDNQVPTIGGLSVCVPGELQGYWDLHEKYGKLEWKKVLEPAIFYCKKGIPISKYCGSFIESRREQIMESPTLKEMFLKDNGELLGFGDKMMRPHLGKTLELVAEKGPSVLYNGELTESFIADIQNEGGVLTFEDMSTYSTAWVDPISSELPEDLIVYSPPPPGSGPVIQLILNVIFGIKDPSDPDPEQKWSRIVETWKHAFGFRCRLEGPKKDNMRKCINHMDADCIESIRSKVLATPKTRQNLDFYSDECFSSYCGGGTCNVCVLAANGDAIAITSSINSAYGAMFASPSTGIILNNHMMDFNVAKDPLSLNDVEPEKQPLSSMSPTIILNKNTGLIRLVIGAAGGPKIITAVSQIILEHILYRVPLEEAMENRRLHHQLMPMKLFYEGGFPFVKEMQNFGHECEELRTIKLNDLFIHFSSSASSIQLIDGVVKAYGDKRRHGFGDTTLKTVQ